MARLPMSYFVGTNVFCEPANPIRDGKVISWLEAHEDELYVSARMKGAIEASFQSITVWCRT